MRRQPRSRSVSPEDGDAAPGATMWETLESRDRTGRLMAAEQIPHQVPRSLWLRVFSLGLRTNQAANQVDGDFWPNRPDGWYEDRRR